MPVVIFCLISLGLGIFFFSPRKSILIEKQSPTKEYSAIIERESEALSQMDSGSGICTDTLYIRSNWFGIKTKAFDIVNSGSRPDISWKSRNSLMVSCPADCKAPADTNVWVGLGTVSVKCENQHSEESTK